MLVLFVPLYIIPIITLGISAPKPFETSLACCLDTFPILQCIWNYVANFDMLRKFAVEAVEDYYYILY